MTTLATPNGFTLDTGGKRLVIDPVTASKGTCAVK
jgi:L-ascorbate metabolism protein UlaG (beta-lactamase superfamily)